MLDFLDNSNYYNNNNFFGIKLDKIKEIKEINCNNNISNLGIPFGLFVKQPITISKPQKTLKKRQKKLSKNKTLKK